MASIVCCFMNGHKDPDHMRLHLYASIDYLLFNAVTLVANLTASSII